MRKWFSVLIVVAVLVALLPALQPAQAITANIPPNIVLNCEGFVDLESNFTADRDNTGVGNEAYFVRGTDGYGNILFDFTDEVSVGFSGSFGSAFWTTPPLANPLTLRLVSLAGNGFPEQVVLVITGICEGLPFVEPAEPVEPEPVAVPGCDVLIPIPATAVGGSFVADAPVYWAPGQLTQPQVTIPAGKSALVIGQDSSGMYAKILWACDFVWVPRASVGPNFDAVWNGKPLPTAVVN